MLRFAHTEFLWGLAAIPVFILIFIGKQVEKKGHGYVGRQGGC